jgi:hypothetical protein
VTPPPAKSRRAFGPVPGTTTGHGILAVISFISSTE